MLGLFHQILCFRIMIPSLHVKVRALHQFASHVPSDLSRIRQVFIPKRLPAIAEMYICHWLWGMWASEKLVLAGASACLNCPNGTTTPAGYIQRERESWLLCETEAVKSQFFIFGLGHVQKDMCLAHHVARRTVRQLLVHFVRFS